MEMGILILFRATCIITAMPANAMQHLITADDRDAVILLHKHLQNDLLRLLIYVHI